MQGESQDSMREVVAYHHVPFAITRITRVKRLCLFQRHIPTDFGRTRGRNYPGTDAHLRSQQHNDVTYECSSRLFSFFLSIDDRKIHDSSCCGMVDSILKSRAK